MYRRVFVAASTTTVMTKNKHPLTIGAFAVHVTDEKQRTMLYEKSMITEELFADWSQMTVEIATLVGMCAATDTINSLKLDPNSKVVILTDCRALAKSLDDAETMRNDRKTALTLFPTDSYYNNPHRPIVPDLLLQYLMKCVQLEQAENALTIQTIATKTTPPKGNKNAPVLLKEQVALLATMKTSLNTVLKDAASFISRI